MSELRMSGTSIAFALAGSGGSGVITAGGLLLDAAGRAGLYGIFQRLSGPQIRGGEAAALLRFADGPVSAPPDVTHVLIALDWQNVDRFAAEIPLAPGSVIVTDPAQGKVPQLLAESGADVLEIPLAALAKSIPGGRANMIAAGLVGALAGIPETVLDAIAEAGIAHKGIEAVAASRAAISAGYAQAAQLPALPRPVCAPGAGRWLMSGNQAAALGALRAGLRFVAGYPITPSTDILEWIIDPLHELGGTLIQAEDELAAINMVIGASYGGVPAMTVTSGPGFSLMSEALGLATAAEIPVLVIDVMRAGPSTGIATKTEQSDLDIALHGLHGDAPHLVLAAESVDDALFTTEWALRLAETLQTAAIVLSDQSIGQTRSIVAAPPPAAAPVERLAPTGASGPYRRYAVTNSGVSPMAAPGQPGHAWIAEGLTHTERGAPSSTAKDHLAQLDKRARKLLTHAFGPAAVTISGSGPVALIAFGSTAAAAREAADRLAAAGTPVRLIVPRLLSPLPVAEIRAALVGVTRTLVVELNHSRQFWRHLRGALDLPGGESHARPGPLPWRPQEIITLIIAAPQAANEAA